MKKPSNRSEFPSKNKEATRPHADRGGQAHGRAIRLESGGTDLHFPRSSLHGGQQRVIGEMAVPHRAFMIGVPQLPLYGKQGNPRIDYEGRRRGTKVMNARVRAPITN